MTSNDSGNEVWSRRLNLPTIRLFQWLKSQFFMSFFLREMKKPKRSVASDRFLQAANGCFPQKNARKIVAEVEKKSWDGQHRCTVCRPTSGIKINQV